MMDKDEEAWKYDINKLKIMLKMNLSKTLSSKVIIKKLEVWFGAIGSYLARLNEIKKLVSHWYK